MKYHPPHHPPSFEIRHRPHTTIIRDPPQRFLTGRLNQLTSDRHQQASINKPASTPASSWSKSSSPSNRPITMPHPHQPTSIAPASPSLHYCVISLSLPSLPLPTPPLLANQQPPGYTTNALPFLHPCHQSNSRLQF